MIKMLLVRPQWLLKRGVTSYYVAPLGQTTRFLLNFLIKLIKNSLLSPKGAV